MYTLISQNFSMQGASLVTTSAVHLYRTILLFRLSYVPRYWEGVWPVSFLKDVLKDDLELNPTA